MNWILGKRLILATGLCLLAAVGFGAMGQHARGTRSAIDPSVLKVAHTGCITVVNGKRIRMAVGDQFSVDGLWRSCTEYDGHAVVIFTQ